MKVFWEVSDFETLMNKISDALVKAETHLEECVSKYDAYADLYFSKIPIIRSFCRRWLWCLGRPFPSPEEA